MEYVGELFRMINPKSWINGVTSIIEKTEEPTIFLIPDVRAPNEANMIFELNGYVTRLLRNPLNRSTTIETAMDADKYNYANFDSVLNNVNMSLEEKNRVGFQEFLRTYNL
jgi:hypothetical protein